METIGESKLPSRLKLLLIWVVFPYLCYMIFVVCMKSFFRPDISVAPIFHFKNIFKGLRGCVLPAAFGTFVLWMLPIQRASLGIVTATVATISCFALQAWILMTFVGGFEENIDIVVGSMMLCVPSCVIGAYAGYLRSKTVANPPTD